MYNYITHVGCISDTKENVCTYTKGIYYVYMYKCRPCFAVSCWVLLCVGTSVMTNFYIPLGLHARGCLYGLLSGESWELSGGERRSPRG